jgi:hypothetical protein
MSRQKTRSKCCARSVLSSLCLPSRKKNSIYPSEVPPVSDMPVSSCTRTSYIHRLSVSIGITRPTSRSLFSTATATVCPSQHNGQSDQMEEMLCEQCNDNKWQLWRHVTDPQRICCSSCIASNMWEIIYPITPNPGFKDWYFGPSVEYVPVHLDREGHEQDFIELNPLLGIKGITQCDLSILRSKVDNTYSDIRCLILRLIQHFH